MHATKSLSLGIHDSCKHGCEWKQGGKITMDVQVLIQPICSTSYNPNIEFSKHHLL